MAFHMQGSSALKKTCIDDALVQTALVVKKGLQSPELSIWHYPALHSQEKFKNTRLLQYKICVISPPDAPRSCKHSWNSHTQDLVYMDTAIDEKGQTHPLPRNEPHVRCLLFLIIRTA